MAGRSKQRNAEMEFLTTRHPPEEYVFCSAVPPVMKKLLLPLKLTVPLAVEKCDLCKRERERVPERVPERERQMHGWIEIAMEMRKRAEVGTEEEGEEGRREEEEEQGNNKKSREIFA